MTAQNGWRKRVSAVLATGTAALLVASGALMVPAAANAVEGDAPAPVVTVSKDTGLNPDGETITVSGSGFVPTDETKGTRPPLLGKFTGVYVAFGYYPDVWQPSTGVASGARKNFDVKWAVHADDMATVGGAANGAIEMSADGSFTTTLAVSEQDLTALAEGNYGIYTYPGGGAKYAPYEIFTPVTFSDGTEVVPAQVTGTVAAATKTGLTVNVAASDLPADISDLYGALIVKDSESTLTGMDSAFPAFALPFPKVTNGSSSFVLNAPVAGLDRTKQYEVILWKKHAEITSETIYARADVAVSSAQWDAVFPKPEPKVPFTDVAQGDKFYKEIAWMYTTGLSTGVKQSDGSVKYLPKSNVTREAMAAFLFRQHAPANYKAPARSPFTDVKTTDKFYKEIAWMAESKISTGVKQPNGTVKYLPKSNITREAMAAFMYRIDTNAKPAAPKVSPFADVKPGDKFYKEIAWMHSSGLSTGIAQPSGKPKYAPKSNVTREAMAAFMYRADR
ncbi:S-layer homology domain-containing protein [Leucobacter sp. PH1c]|uniref:S-layer homology domain-containing protein n=1 Tax=Leucobacter sp. PH1c TaxID=1397278 RepID=UPI000469E088|nr:S-layer homology domain-containing protein [Leucobacter sp. PH1c]